jgi:hypothetical protein
MPPKTLKTLFRVVLVAAGLFALVVLAAMVFYMAVGGTSRQQIEEANRRDTVVVTVPEEAKPLTVIDAALSVIRLRRPLAV